jgi:integrase
MITVAEACRRWLAHWREQGRNDFGLNRDQRVLERFVYAHPIGAVSLDRLTAEMLVRWRRDLATAPVTGKKVGKEAVAAGGKRSASTVNRNLDPLRGALSLAHREGMKVNRVWHEALAKTKHVVGRRDEYLDIGQRRALLDACPADAAKFFKGLCLLPFRPGAMAHLTVGQFDTRLRRLHVGKDKAGANRYVTLPPDTAEFFTEQCKGKLPSACIFMQANGRPFDNQTWWKTFRDAAAVAKLPAKACTYTLRHSTITDLLTLHKLDIYTVADLAGTSPEQIRDHYRHVLQGHAEDALAKLALGLLKSPHMAEKS